MDFRSVLALRGPNIWAKRPVLEVCVDLGEFGDPADPLDAGALERVNACWRTLSEHSRKVGRQWTFDGPHSEFNAADFLARLVLELQNMAWLWQPAEFCRVRKGTGAGVYRIAVEYEEERLARACFDSARELSLAAMRGEAFDVAAEIDRLHDLAYEVCLRSNTRPMVVAARARSIPCYRLDDGSLVQFGQGARQRRTQSGVTDKTGAIALHISQDKELSKRVLRTAGVPVSQGRPVADAADAWAAACEVGIPVVVKPQDADYGQGVSLNLATREQVSAAYARARKVREKVLVERFAPGIEHRLLVVGDRVISALRRDLECVVGDGRQTIAQLVDELNRRPLRGRHYYLDIWDPINLGDTDLAALATQGYRLDSILPAGTLVSFDKKTQRVINTDVTDQVHPEVAARVVDAVRAVGLDIAGVDVVATDVGRPLEDQGGVVVEVNEGPALWEHIYPMARPGRPVHEAIVSLLFFPGETGRIPLVAVAASPADTTTARLIAHILICPGRRIGTACADGIYLDARRIHQSPGSRVDAADTVLLNPLVDLGVLETDARSIVGEGLGFDLCNVAVLSDIPGECDDGDLARAAQTLVEAVAADGVFVLSADYPQATQLAAHCPGDVIFISVSPDHPVIAAHRDRGGRAVFLRGAAVILATGAETTELIPTSRILACQPGHDTSNLEAILAAVAATWTLGISSDTIAARLVCGEW